MAREASEDATFKLKQEGTGASLRNSPYGPGARSSSAKALRQREGKSMQFIAASAPLGSASLSRAN